MLGSSARGHRRVLRHLAHTIGANAVCECGVRRTRAGGPRVREYATKLEAYYRYRDSGSAARDYIGFPSVLVVTTRARAEEQIAYQAFLASERHSRALPLLLTTTRHIEVNAEGILGPIWRAPGPLGGIVLRRGYWLPGGHPSGLLRSLRDGPPANTSVVTASSWSTKGAR